MSNYRKKKLAVVPALPAVAVPSATPESKPAPRLPRIAEAARYLSATTWFIRSLIWSHSIPFLQLGKRHLIDVRDLDAYIDSQKTGAA